MTKNTLSDDVVSRVLASTAPYADEAQKETCMRMVSELTKEEQETAARTSYAYWTAAELKQNGPPSENIRIRMAMREARRHLVGEGSYDKGLTALRACCAFRKERKVDMFRTLFDSSWNHSGEDDSKMAGLYRLHLEEESSKQVMVVRGMDRDSRAIAIKMPRESSETNEEAFVTAQLYVAERAIAATEILSEGREEKVVAIFEFGNYSSSNAPPFRVMRAMAQILQRNYPERLSHLCILDPPFFMRTVYTLIHPFLRPDTKEKVIMLSDEASKQKQLGSLISNDQAMPFMLPDGKLTPEISADYFLKSVPFYCLYDEGPPITSA